MKKTGALILSFAVILLASLFAGANLYAYFSDTETSTGNIFTAGTLDLKLSHTGVDSWNDGVTATWTLSNMKPRDETPLASVFFKNFGSVASSTMEINL